MSWLLKDNGRRWVYLLILSLGMLSTDKLWARSVALPLTLDSDLLTSLLIKNGFTGKNQTVALVGNEGDCVHVRISDPHYSTNNGLLSLELKLFVRVGTTLGENCFVPVEWQGYLTLLQRPLLNAQNLTLSFQSVGSELYDLTRRPAKVAGLLWNFAQPKVYEYLDQIQLDLAPPVADLKRFLGPLFLPKMQQTVETFKPGVVTVDSEGLHFELTAHFKDLQTVEPLPRVVLTAAQRKEAIQVWEIWDSFLVQLLTTMAMSPLSPRDQDTFLHVLLGVRHGFVESMGQKNFQQDLVKIQFLWAWQQLAPVFRRQLYTQSSENLLGYLAFFTAADALAVLDTMGPDFGLDISEQGLYRLSTMLKSSGVKLDYSSELDGALRELLHFGSSNGSDYPLPATEEIDLPEQSQKQPLSYFSEFLVQPLWAAGGNETPTFKEILRWKVPRKNHGEYVVKVQSVLAEAAEKVVRRKEIPEGLQGMYRDLIIAVAWQESCFRQFVVKKKKLTYLLSYNGSSVGVMQINERIWRGLYDKNRLRWDIRYNALAGCEILDLYLRRYVLQDKMWKKKENNKLLGQVLYSMYNGGPSQYKKFLARASEPGKHYQSDKLFLEKFKLVLAGKWSQVKTCFVGG